MKRRDRSSAYGPGGAESDGGGSKTLTSRRASQHRGSVARIGNGDIFAGSELTKKRRVEALLFPVFYALCEKEREKSSFEKMVGPLLWLPDVFQLLALCIQGSHTWHHSAVRWIDVLGNFSTIITDSMGSAGFSALFWLSNALVLMALLDTIFVAFLFKRQIYTMLWPVKALRLLTGTIVTAFFIPVLSFLLVGPQCAVQAPDLRRALAGGDALDCLSFPLIIMNAVSALFLLPFLAFGLVVSLLYYNYDWKSGDLVAQAHGRIEGVFTAARAFLVILAALVPPDSFWVPFALLVVTAGLSLAYALFLPYYKYRVNAFRSGLMSATSFFALATLILSALPEEASDGARLGASVVLLLLSAAAFFAGPAVTRWRYRRLQRARESPLVRMQTEIAAQGGPGTFSPAGGRRGASPLSSVVIHSGSAQNLDAAAAAAAAAAVDDAEEGAGQGRVQGRVRSVLSASSSVSPAPNAAVTSRGRIFWFETDVEIATRFVHEKDNLGKRGAAAEGEAPAEKLFAEAEGVFAEGARQFGGASAFISLARIIYLQSLSANESQMMFEWKKFGSLKPRFDHRFMAYQLRNDQAHMSQGHEAGARGQRMNIVQMMEFARDMRVAIKSHNEALKLLRSFYMWAYKQKYKDSESAGRRLDAIDKAKRRASTVYSKLLEQFPTSAPLLRNYAVYVRDIENDEDYANSFFSQADYIEEQNARAAGVDGETASGRDSSAAGDSSSAGGSSASGRRRNTAAAPRVKKNRAVRTLFFIIAICTVVLVAEPIIFFIVSQELFKMYDASIVDLNNAGLRRKLSQDVLYFTRSAQMAAAMNDTTAYAAAAASLKKFSGDLKRIHENLYTKAANLWWSPTIWRKPVWSAFRLVSTAPEPATVVVDKLSALDLVEQYAAYATLLGSGPITQFNGDWSTQNAAFRYILDNGPTSVIPALNVNCRAYEDEMFTTAYERQMILLALFLFEVLTIVALAFFALRPDAMFKRIREASLGAQDVLHKVPRRSMRRVYYIYKGRDYIESDDEEDEQALPKGAEGAAAGKATVTSVAVAGSDHEHEHDGSGGETDRHAAPAHAVTNVTLARRASEEATNSDSEVGSDASAGHHGHAHHAHHKARRQSPAGHRGAAGPSALKRVVEAGAEADGETLRRFLTEGEGVSALPLSELPGVVALEPGSSPSSFEAVKPAAGELGGPEVDDLELGADADAVISIAPVHPAGAGAGAGGDGWPWAQQRGAAGAAGEGQRAFTSPAGRGPSGSRGSFGKRLVSGEKHHGHGHGHGHHGKHEHHASGLHGQEASAAVAQLLRANPQLRGGLDVDSPNDSQHGGHRRISFSAHAQQFTMPAPPPKSTLAAIEDIDAAPNREPRGGGGGGGAGPHVGGPPARRSGILRRFFWRYIFAFTLVGLIAMANFLTCFLAIQVGKYISSEINTGGRRRYTAREVSFFARELALADGAFMPKPLIAWRLQSDLAFLRKIHEGLKYGDKDFNTPGSSLRYQPMEDLFYKPGCILLDQKLCANRQSVDPARTGIGFDPLVYFFLEQADRVLNTFWYSSPDFVPPPAEYKANPCLNLFDSERCSYEHNPARLPDEAAAVAAERGLPIRGYHGRRARPGVKYSTAALAAASPALAFVMEQTQPSGGDFFDGTQRALNLYFEEHMARLNAVSVAQVAFLVAHLGLLLAITVLLFRPMLLHLKRESGRLGQLLSTVPPEVATDDKFFAPYFAKHEESDGEDGEEHEHA
eukprot:tig00000857_g4924.t1